MPRTVRTAAVRAPRAAPFERERSDKYFSKVIGKALDIIAILRSSAQPLSLNELTLRLELAKSSVFRILHTLEVSGYIDRDAAGRYTVAADLRAWGPGQLRAALVDAATAGLKELSREFCETVSLAMRFENRVEVIATLESPHLIRMGNTVAASCRRTPARSARRSPRFSPKRCATGSFGATASIALPNTRSRTKSSSNASSSSCARAATAPIEEESVLEGCCFGTPILDANGDAIAAISISSPKMRVRDERLQKRLVTALRRAARQRPAAGSPG